MLLRLLFGGFLLLGLIACKQNTCLHPAGKTSSELVSLEGIRHIEIHDVFDVIWIPDTVLCEVEIRGGEHNLSFIDYAQEEGKITFRNHNRCGFLRNDFPGVQLIVRSNAIHEWTIPGSISLEMTDTLHTDSVSFSFNGGINDVNLLINAFKTSISLNGGSGKYTIEGKSVLGYAYFFGNGIYEARHFENRQLYLNHQTTGNLHIKPTDLLSLKLEGRGNVYYYGPIHQINVQSTADYAGELIGPIEENDF